MLQKQRCYRRLNYYSLYWNMASLFLLNYIQRLTDDFNFLHITVNWKKLSYLCGQHKCWLSFFFSIFLISVFSQSVNSNSWIIYCNSTKPAIVAFYCIHYKMVDGECTKKNEQKDVKKRVVSHLFQPDVFQGRKWRFAHFLRTVLIACQEQCGLYLLYTLFLWKFATSTVAKT